MNVSIADVTINALHLVARIEEVAPVSDVRIAIGIAQLASGLAEMSNIAETIDEAIELIIQNISAGNVENAMVGLTLLKNVTSEFAGGHERVIEAMLATVVNQAA